MLIVGLVCIAVSCADGNKPCCKEFSDVQKLFLKNMLKKEAKGLRNEMLSALSVPRVKWFKLSTKPVCFSAKGNQFGKFIVKAEGFLSALKLDHVSGGVTCNKSATPKSHSKWGCSPSHSFIGKDSLNTLITTATNEVVFPKEDELTHDMPNYWYHQEQFDADSSVLVFKRFHDPLYVTALQELRIWYGEDLADANENDNDGQTCAHVFGLYH